MKLPIKNLFPSSTLAGIMSMSELLIGHPRKIIWIWCLNTLCTKRDTIICECYLPTFFQKTQIFNLYYQTYNLIFSGQKEYMIIILFRVKKYSLKVSLNNVCTYFWFIFECHVFLNCYKKNKTLRIIGQCLSESFRDGLLSIPNSIN